VAEIVVFSGETQRLAEFLDEQLDPASNPIVGLLSDRLPHDRWLVLQDLLHRKLAFFCIAWLTWHATIDVARRLRVVETPDAFLADVPAEVHELMWTDIPADIMSTFDNSESYRSFNDRWGQLINEWATERGWDPLALPFRWQDRSEELVELERWLQERGFDDGHKPIQNLLVEVMVELANRGRAFVVQGRSSEDYFDALLSSTG
jgi:hypothetical protein